MKQLKNFLIKREQSQARLSFAKREKSRLLAKTLLTLVALLAVTTGAWAETTYTVAGSNSDMFGSAWDADATANDMTKNGDGTYSITYTNVYLDGDVQYKVLGNHDWENAYPIDDNRVINIAEAGTYTVTIHFNPTTHEVYETMPGSGSGGPEVAWDGAKKSGTFTMPGGNVTLEPEYYPQAAVADGGVTAADADARATTDDPLVKVDATKLTGAKKLMYFVSNSGTTAPAYDAEGWTDQLPTAEGFTQQGIVYVWYYPVGIDEGVDGATATYSDGDICLQSITARIAAAPTYAVTFAEGVNPEPPAEPEWTASPAANVTKGQTVTVTYSGTKKVIGVKAEKKAKAPATITVTWNNDDITGSGNSFTKDGVTLTAGFIDFGEKIFMSDGTFTTTLGNFTKIEVTASSWGASGTGWSGKTWTGNASSVSYDGDIMGMGNVVFTIEPTN